MTTIVAIENNETQLTYLVSKQILSTSLNFSVSAGTGYYYPVNGGGAYNSGNTSYSAGTGNVIGFPMTITNVSYKGFASVSGTDTFTLYQNGVATPITFSPTTLVSNVSLTGSSNANTIFVNPMDDLCWKYTTNTIFKYVTITLEADFNV